MYNIQSFDWGNSVALHNDLRMTRNMAGILAFISITILSLGAVNFDFRIWNLFEIYCLHCSNDVKYIIYCSIEW